MRYSGEPLVDVHTDDLIGIVSFGQGAKGSFRTLFTLISMLCVTGYMKFGVQKELVVTCYNALI